MKKIQAFTLAEILITLGIIGVVAALTMPSLIENYQKKVLEVQLQKTISTLQNGLKKIMADEEVESIFESSVGSHTSFELNHYFGIYSDRIGGLMKLEAIKENSKFYDFINDSMSTGGGNYTGYYLQNGACVGFSNTGMYSYRGDNPYFAVIIDVNCDKGPNLNSKDRFEFLFGKYSEIVPPYVMDMEAVDEFCKNLTSISDEEEKLFANIYSLRCGYSVMRNGWKFIY